MPATQVDTSTSSSRAVVSRIAWRIVPRRLPRESWVLLFPIIDLCSCPKMSSSVQFFRETGRIAYCCKAATRFARVRSPAPGSLERQPEDVRGALVGPLQLIFGTQKPGSSPSSSFWGVSSTFPPSRPHAMKVHFCSLSRMAS